MSFLHHKGLLNIIYTQNIDCLELKTQIPESKIVFAHGNSCKAHCPVCKTDVEIERMNKHIEEGNILYCHDEDCKTPCKPKIVFYGESLPKEFNQKMEVVVESDLAFVMGTSLKVMPFNMLPEMVEGSAWRVVINKEKVGNYHYDKVESHDLFLEGFTDEVILKLLKDIEWEDDFETYLKIHKK
jgi:NAD-dependent histone deacetylase SIR2